MKTYKVFDRGGQKIAIKQGWSWPAFFLGWIWAFAKKLFLAGTIGLLAVIIPAVALTIADKKGDKKGSAAVLVGIVFALKGNKWWGDNLVKNGYTLLGTVQAKNPVEAASIKL